MAAAAPQIMAAALPTSLSEQLQSCLEASSDFDNVRELELVVGTVSDEATRRAAVKLFHHTHPEVPRTFLHKLLASKRTATVYVVSDRKSGFQTQSAAASKAAPSATRRPPASAASDSTASDYSDAGRREARVGLDGNRSSDYELEDSVNTESTLCSLTDEDDQPAASEMATGASSGAAAPPDDYYLSERIVGCVTVEEVEKVDHDSSRVLQISLVGVRSRFQGLGVGTRLVQAVQRLVFRTQCFQSVVTCADSSSSGFFTRMSFTDDVILNSRYSSSVKESWENTVLLSYVAPLAVPPPLRSPVPNQEQRRSYINGDDLDAKVQQWRQHKLAEYSSELSLVESMKHEITLLRLRVTKQENTIAKHETTIAELQRKE